MKLFTLTKRVLLFFLVNIVIIVSLSLVLSLLGVKPYLDAKGIQYESLLLFCAIWGMGGALISLALSRVMAKWMTGAHVISEQTRNSQEQWLLESVHELARSAGLPRMPEVAIYESEEVNAFATGPTKSRSLVAVSSGLLRRMDQRSVLGVLGHEIAHIANGDMVTMTLIQGVVNAFIMFFARVVAWSLSQFVDEEKRGFVQLISTLAFEIVFGFLGLLVVSAFSRHREFRADEGGARLAGADQMIRALYSLKKVSAGENTPEESSPALAAFKISERRSGGILALFSTHPPLEERIARLEERYG